MKKLSLSFFNHKAPVVAKNLLGCVLVRKTKRGEIRLVITETEAYDGFKDLASHASRGKTARNSPMFKSAGHFYVYFTYGIHWLLNIVTGEKDYPSAVLIRKAENSDGKIILNGPAKLTKFLEIDKTLNGKKLGEKVGLWIEKRNPDIKMKKIKLGARIGVGYAGEIWANKKWRFCFED